MRRRWRKGRKTVGARSRRRMHTMEGSETSAVVHAHTSEILAPKFWELTRIRGRHVRSCRPRRGRACFANQ